MEEEKESAEEMSPSPDDAAGFSDQNKEWLKPTKRKREKQRVGPLPGSDGDSDPDPGK